MTRNTMLVGTALVVGIIAGVWYWQHMPAAPAQSGDTAQLANPASVNCTHNGGTLEMRDETGGQVGYCHLPSGDVCEEWALFRNECTASTTAKLAIDLYPLYSGVVWSNAVTETFTIGTTTYTGASATSTTIDVGMDPNKAITPFTAYYSKLLKNHGWSVANDLAAGGPIGGQDGYRNGSGVILVRYSIDYKNTPKDAPVQCPCAVSFSLFSNVGN